MIDDQKSDLERLIIKDALLAKNSDNGLVGIRIWRGKEWTLSNKETWRNWDSIGHVALKTYGQDSQYISFFPSRCNSEFSNDQKHNERDHLHSEQQDEVSGTPKEFLIRVHNIDKINEKIRTLTEAIEQGQYTWKIINNCSHLTHQLLAIGGIKFTFSMKNKIMLRFFLYYFIKKYWLLITATTFLTRLINNSNYLLNWQFKYESYLFHNNLSEKNLLLSTIKFFNGYMDKIFEQAKKSGRTWGYVYGILATGVLLSPVISLFIFTIKNFLIITPEDIYLRAKELDLLKNHNQTLKNKSTSAFPSLVYDEVSITDRIAWVSVISPAQNPGTSKQDTSQKNVSKIINFLGGHAVLVAEALMGNIIDIFKEKLQRVQDEITDIEIIRRPFTNEFRKMEELALSSSKDNFIVYFYKKIKLYGLESTSENTAVLKPKILAKLEELDKIKEQKEFEKKYLESEIGKLRNFSEHARYFAIFDIHAQPEHKLLSLPKCKSHIGGNYKGYIDKIKVRQYIIDAFKGVFEISPAGIIQQDLTNWLSWLNNKIDPARKDRSRLYPLGPCALNRLITNIQLESKQVAQLMKEKKYTDLPKWQFLGKYGLFPIKDWDGLNCSEWCNDHLYRVGAISRGTATAKSKPPKGIREIFVNSLSFTFG